MTVKELIEKLAAVDPNGKVLVRADEDGASAYFVEVVTEEDDFPYLKSGYSPEELGFDFSVPVVVIQG